MAFELASAALDYDDDGESLGDPTPQHNDLLAAALLDAQVGLDQNEDQDEEGEDEEDPEGSYDNETEDGPSFHKGYVYQYLEFR
jgi:hypothetical protein